MKSTDSKAYKSVRQDYERRFLNAGSNYDRYQVLLEVLSFVEELLDEVDSKENTIARLRSEIVGYDLKEYEQALDRKTNV